MKTELKQDRAIKTREKLITVGFEVLAKNGYHNVTMDEIAKAAGVATGSAYRYFKNKKELFIGILEYYYNNIEKFAGITDYSLDMQMAFKDYLPQILDQFYKIHQKYWDFHEELEGLCHIDKDIGQLKKKLIKKSVDNIVCKMPEDLKEVSHLKENIYIAIQILEDVSHFMINKPDENLDIDYMKEKAIHLTMLLIEKD